MTSFNKKRAYRSILLAASVLSLFTYTNASASELEASSDNIEEEKAEFDDGRSEEEVLEGEEITSPELEGVEVTDDIEIDSEEESSLDILEVREATMEVFTSRSSNHPSYTTTFINTISPSAVKLGEEYGLYPSVIIAQAALESGWGGHSPALPDDYVLSLPPNHNLFGVKGDYKGNSVL